MLVNLNKFELLNYINGCAIGSHLRQGIWQRCVDEFYDKLNDNERAFIYEFSLRDFWEIMARAKFPNVNKEYANCGFEDYRKFLACFKPGNRYDVILKGNMKGGKPMTEKVEAYLFNGGYWVGFQRHIDTKCIKSIKRKEE